MKPTDITGQKFGHLTAVVFVRSIVQGKQTRHFWLFQCDCGNDAVMCKDSVIHSLAISCGCQKHKQLEQHNAEVANRALAMATAPQPKANKKTELLAGQLINRSMVPESMRNLPSRIIKERHTAGQSFSSSYLPRGISSSGRMENLG